MTVRARATAAFTRRFGRPPDHVVGAPGRVELLGNHTDYNEGLVLAAAVDLCLAIAAAPRSDAQLRLRSLEEDDEVAVDPAACDPAAVAPWARYPAGVAAALRSCGTRVPGFDAVVASDIPVGAGLGSSAAFEVATALAIWGLDGSRPGLADAERWELAHLCRAAERDWAGVPCGLLDQASVLFGATQPPRIAEIAKDSPASLRSIAAAPPPHYSITPSSAPPREPPTSAPLGFGLAFPA